MTTLAEHIALHGEHLTEQNGDAYWERQSLLGGSAPVTPTEADPGDQSAGVEVAVAPPDEAADVPAAPADAYKAHDKFLAYNKDDVSPVSLNYNAADDDPADDL